MTWQHLIWPVILALLFFWGVGVRARLGKLRRHIELAFSQLHAQLKHRHAMLEPFLQATHAQGAAYTEALERTLAAKEQVMAACELMLTHPHKTGAVKTLKMAEDVFQTAMRAFLAQVPSQAQIKPTAAAEGSWLPFNEAWADADKRVSYARHVYNESTHHYNSAATQWPTRWVGRVLGFTHALSL